MKSLVSTKSPFEFGLPSISEGVALNILKAIPIVKKETLTHVGHLDSAKQFNGFQEGFLLSASEFPDEWSEIARLSGPEWEIFREDGEILLLDMYAKNECWKNLESFGLNNNLLVEKTSYIVPCNTDEEGELIYTTVCETWEDAQASHDPELGEIKKESLLYPSQILWYFWIQRSSAENKTPINSFFRAALCSYILEVAAINNWKSFPDGLFWDEDLCVGRYSGPRAGILPSKILCGDILCENYL